MKLSLSTLIKLPSFGTRINAIVLFWCIFISISGNNVHSQVTFTDSELLELAKKNEERKFLKEINSSLNQEIDSLNSQKELFRGILALKDSTIESYQTITKNYKTIDQIRINDSNQKNTFIETQRKTIDSQKKKLTFWRILTPVAIIFLSIIILK